MNTHQEIAPDADECILSALLMSFIHQNRGRDSHRHFASDADRSRDFAATLGIAPDRLYGSWQEIAEQEAQRKMALRWSAL